MLRQVDRQSIVVDCVILFDCLTLKMKTLVSFDMSV